MNRIAKIFLKIPIRGGDRESIQFAEFWRFYAVFCLVLQTTWHKN